MHRGRLRFRLPTSGADGYTLPASGRMDAGDIALRIWGKTRVPCYAVNPISVWFRSVSASVSSRGLARMMVGGPGGVSCFFRG